MTDKTPNDNLQDIVEDLRNYSYQWIKGDSIGKINEFQDIVEFNGNVYVLFTDGSRIGLNILDEFVVKIEKGYFEPEIPRVQTLIPPREVVQPRQNIEFIRQERLESPIAELLRKQKENWVDVNITLSINLPKKALWDVIVSSFDNAEEEIIEIVTNELNIEIVREALRKSVKDIYLTKTNSPKNVRASNNISEREG